MTDAEIVARALRDHLWIQGADGSYTVNTVEVSRAVVAALTEAGRLVPDGCVAINAGRWERVRRVASSARAMMRGEPDDMTLLLYPGDLDVEPTP